MPEIVEKPSPLASYAAGDIATQTLLSMLINLYIGGCEDRESARTEITNAAINMVDRAHVPDLPAADQSAVRTQAKWLVRALITGERRN